MCEHNNDFRLMNAEQLRQENSKPFMFGFDESIITSLLLKGYLTGHFDTGSRKAYVFYESWECLLKYISYIKELKNFENNNKIPPEKIPEYAVFGNKPLKCNAADWYTVPELVNKLNTNSNLIQKRRVDSRFLYQLLRVEMLIAMYERSIKTNAILIHSLQELVAYRNHVCYTNTDSYDSLNL